MMIEEQLINYGVLGIWTATLLIEKYRHQKEMKGVVENNTKALTRFYEIIQKCKKK